jgi:YVTN family beta-propeller protein
MRFLRLVLLFVLVSTTAFAARLRQVAILDLPGQPGFDTLAIANGCLLVAHSATDSVDIVDLTKRRVIAQVKHVRGAAGIAVDDKNKRVYLSAPDSRRIVAISSEDWDVKSVIPVQTDVEQIIYVPTNNRIYVANSQDRTVAFVDLAKNNQVHQIDADAMPERLAFDPEKNLIYATLEDKHAVAVYDLELKPIATWVLKASQPTGLALDASARRLYVAVRYAVVTLDADTGAELSRVGAPAGVDTLWYDRDSGTMFAAAGGTVCIMKTREGGLTSTAELNIDVHGSSLAYDPKTQLIYLPGGREGHSKLLILRPIQSDIPAIVLKDKHARGAAEGQ